MTKPGEVMQTIPQRDFFRYERIEAAASRELFVLDSFFRAIAADDQTLTVSQDAFVILCAIRERLREALKTSPT